MFWGSNKFESHRFSCQFLLLSVLLYLMIVTYCYKWLTGIIDQSTVETLFMIQIPYSRIFHRNLYSAWLHTKTMVQCCKGKINEQKMWDLSLRIQTLTDKDTRKLGCMAIAISRSHLEGDKISSVVYLKHAGGLCAPRSYMGTNFKDYQNQSSLI